MHMLYMLSHVHVLVAAVSSSLTSSTAAREAALGCHHVAWPLLKDERIKNMREFSERTGACRSLLTIRAVTPDTTTWRFVRRRVWNITSEGPWTVISRSASFMPSIDCVSNLDTTPSSMGHGDVRNLADGSRRFTPGT